MNHGNKQLTGCQQTDLVNVPGEIAAEPPKYTTAPTTPEIASANNALMSLINEEATQPELSAPVETSTAEPAEAAPEVPEQPVEDNTAALEPITTSPAEEVPLEEPDAAAAE